MRLPAGNRNKIYFIKRTGEDKGKSVCVWGGVVAQTGEQSGRGISHEFF